MAKSGVSQFRCRGDLLRGRLQFTQPQRVNPGRFTIIWGAYPGLLLSIGGNADFLLGEKLRFYVAFAAGAGAFLGKEHLL